MARTGTVTDCDGEVASVALDPPCRPESCLNCSVGCKGHSPTRYSGLTVKVQVSENVPVGARVELEVELPNEAVMSFIGFGIPLAAVFWAGWLAHYIYPGSDLWLVGGGTAGLAGGFGLVALICRLVSYCQPRVRYVRMLEDEVSPKKATPERVAF